MQLKPLALIFLALVFAGCASTSAPKADPAMVRVVTSRNAVSSCGDMLAIVKDDDLNDLRKKAAKKGGDHVVIVGHSVLSGADPLVNPFFKDRHVVMGEVYRCLK